MRKQIIMIYILHFVLLYISVSAFASISHVFMCEREIATRDFKVSPCDSITYERESDVKVTS